MVQYSHTRRVEFQFVDDDITFQQELDAVPFLGGGTFTGKALDFAYEEIIKDKTRPGVKVVMVVLTDGISFDNFLTPTNLIKNQGIDIFAVGYGAASESQLNIIASDPDEEYMYIGTSMEELLQFSSNLTRKLCSEEVVTSGRRDLHLLKDEIFDIDY